MITELKINQLYRIEDKLLILCKSEFKHCKSNTIIRKYYFRKPTFEDGQSFNLIKLSDKLIGKENDILPLPKGRGISQN